MLKYTVTPEPTSIRVVFAKKAQTFTWSHARWFEAVPLWLEVLNESNEFSMNYSRLKARICPLNLCLLYKLDIQSTIVCLTRQSLIVWTRFVGPESRLSPVWILDCTAHETICCTSMFSVVNTQTDQNRGSRKGQRIWPFLLPLFFDPITLLRGSRRKSVVNFGCALWFHFNQHGDASAHRVIWLKSLMSLQARRRRIGLVRAVRAWVMWHFLVPRWSFKLKDVEIESNQRWCSESHIFPEAPTPSLAAPVSQFCINTYFNHYYMH